MMLTRVPSDLIPPARLPLVDCCYCWYALHPDEPFPSAWSSTICSEHADWQIERLAAARRRVNFVLIESAPDPEPLYFPFVNHRNRPEYPANWSKASWTLRRALGFRCQICGSSVGTAVHHIGAGFPTGCAGNPKDKHDLRWPENLIVLCQVHHDQADQEQRLQRRRR